MGVVFPGSYCDEAETVSHHWIEAEKAFGGVLFKCKLCFDYLWLPLNWYDAERLTRVIKQFGVQEGYCRYLNRHRSAKLLMAKMQDLRRLQTKSTNKREFAKLTDKILSDRNYDRRNVTNGT